MLDILGNKTNMVAAAFMCVAMNVSAQVAAFNPSVTADGVNYILPKTAVKADVYAIKTVYTPGEYAKYADRYLHLGNAKTESETNWYVSDVEVYEVGVPDTLKRYSVKAKDKNLLPRVQLDKSGIILSINDIVEEKEVTLPATRSTNHKLDYRKYLNEEMLAATSSSKLAELIAAEILEIRDSKNAIKRGQVESMPKDGASLKIVLDELDVQEEALTQLFTGYTDTVYCAKSYTFVPEQDIEKQVFFRFSHKLGYVDADDLSGEPYYMDVKDLHTVQLPTEKEAAKRKIVGMVYNVPGMATVTVYSAANTYFNKDIPFAQLGTIDMLSSSLFGKGVTTKVLFSQPTGAVTLVE